MLSFSKRDAFLGGETKGKVKTVDGQEQRQLTFLVEEFLIDENELNSLLGEPHAWRSLYNDGADGVKPFLNCLKSLELKKGISGAFVSVTFGLDRTEMTFTNCDLSKIKLALTDGEGGKTKLQCKVTVAPTLDESLASLFEQFGKKVEVEIRGESPTAQQDLPLNRHGAGEVGTTSDTKAAKAREAIDKTRVLSPGQAENEAETERQLGQALRGLQKQDGNGAAPAPAEKPVRRRRGETRAH